MFIFSPQNKGADRLPPGNGAKVQKKYGVTWQDNRLRI